MPLRASARGRGRMWTSLFLRKRKGEPLLPLKSVLGKLRHTVRICDDVRSRSQYRREFPKSRSAPREALYIGFLDEQKDQFGEERQYYKCLRARPSLLRYPRTGQSLLYRTELYVSIDKRWTFQGHGAVARPQNRREGQ
jgi:hypothetical protein